MKKVGKRRLELPTPTSRTWYATNCATFRSTPLMAFLGAKATKSGFLENRCKGTKKREKRKEKSEKMHAEAGKTFFSAKFLLICLRSSVFCLTFALANSEEGQKTQNGAIAQLVEQRTENPCVPGSIPGGTTEQTKGYVEKTCPLSFFLSLPAPSSNLLSICWA